MTSNTGKPETLFNSVKFFLAMITHALIAGFFLVCALVVIPIAFIIAIVRQDMDYKRRKKKYEEERALARSQFAAEIDAILARQVAAQKNQQPAVSVPVTYAERQERRRVIKLYK